VYIIIIQLNCIIFIQLNCIKSNTLTLYIMFDLTLIYVIIPIEGLAIIITITFEKKLKGGFA